MEGEHEALVLAWRRRIDDERASRRRRADEALALAKSLARRLVAELGARRVALFGSVARGELSPTSDVDLAVWGLPEGRYVDALVMVHAGHDLEIDLVPYERALPHIRRSIDREAVDLATEEQG